MIVYCLDGRSLLEHGIGLSFSDMVQQTCRNHRIHFFFLITKLLIRLIEKVSTIA